MKFILDERLKQDSISILNLQLCEVRLMNDKQYPWLVLVPQRANCTEIIDLSLDEQSLLLAEIRLCCEEFKLRYPNHKLNVANLGNVVSQLHLHIVARHSDDRAWPGPVWGAFPCEAYDQSVLAETVDALANALKARATKLP